MGCIPLVIVTLTIVQICLAFPPPLISVNPVDDSLSAVQQPPVNSPYEFGFEFGDGLGMTQHRREVADGTGAVRGSYGYLDPSGVSRVVEYNAGNDGYRAVIQSNEPGVAGQNPANAYFIVQPPPAVAVSQGLRPVIRVVSK